MDKINQLDKTGIELKNQIIAGYQDMLAECRAENDKLKDTLLDLEAANESLTEEVMSLRKHEKR